MVRFLDIVIYNFGVPGGFWVDKDIVICKLYIWLGALLSIVVFHKHHYNHHIVLQVTPRLPSTRRVNWKDFFLGTWLERFRKETCRQWLIIPPKRRMPWGTNISHNWANDMRVVLNSFIWKTSSSPKKISFAELSRTPCFFFRGTCRRRFLRRTWMCDILKLFQASDPSSHFILRQLHLNIYVLL